MSVAVEHLPLSLKPDPGRVIMRFFGAGNVNRARDIINRVLDYSEADVEGLVAGLAADFGAKHPGLEDAFAEHYEMVRPNVPEARELSRPRQLLLGACFTMEYALESVALFNPSIVPALSQEGVSPGSVRFVMSLRATGEGHVSSIIFRLGMLDEQGNIELEPPEAQGRPLKASVPDEFRKDAIQKGPGRPGSDRRTGLAGPRSTGTAVHTLRAVDGHR